jgi:hypothetical protein
LVDIALLQSVSYIAGALGVCVAAIYYVLNLRATLQTRQIQLFMQIFQRFQEPDFANQWNILMNREWKDFDDYWNKYGGNQSSDGATLLSVQEYFEGIGVLLMKKMIDVDIVYELMPTMATTFWKKYEPLVIQTRKKINYPQFFRPVEYLSDRLVEQAKLRGDPVVLSYGGNSEASR